MGGVGKNQPRYNTRIRSIIMHTSVLFKQLLNDDEDKKKPFRNHSRSSAGGNLTCATMPTMVKIGINNQPLDSISELQNRSILMCFFLEASVSTID